MQELDRVVAEGLRSLLQKKYDVIGIVPDGRELLVQAPNLKPDVIVLDIGMPLLNGLDAAERLKSSLPNVKLVFLTMKDDANLAAAALNLGGSGIRPQARRSFGVAEGSFGSAAGEVIRNG